MQNPIPKSTLWTTPLDLNDLYAQLDHYTGEHAAIAMHVAILTMNTCNRLVEAELKKDAATA